MIDQYSNCIIHRTIGVNQAILYFQYSFRLVWINMHMVTVFLYNAQLVVNPWPKYFDRATWYAVQYCSQSVRSGISKRQPCRTIKRGHAHRP